MKSKREFDLITEEQVGLRKDFETITTGRADRLTVMKSKTNHVMRVYRTLL